MIRLDKYLADMGIGTRQEVKRYIRQGRVSIDGIPAKSPETKIEEKARKITFDGREVDYADYEYYMLNKPSGVVSATEDARCTTVVDLIRDKKRKDLFPVGRLDKDTEGLLLITNDGQLSHRLLSPKKHVDKTYYAQSGREGYEGGRESLSGGRQYRNRRERRMDQAGRAGHSKERGSIRDPPYHPGREVPSGEAYVPGRRKGSPLPEAGIDGLPETG